MNSVWQSPRRQQNPAEAADLWATEKVFIGMLRSEDDIRVDLVDGGMEWTVGKTRLLFSSAETPPLPPTIAEIEYSSIGRLDRP